MLAFLMLLAVLMVVLHHPALLSCLVTCGQDWGSRGFSRRSSLDGGSGLGLGGSSRRLGRGSRCLRDDDTVAEACGGGERGDTKIFVFAPSALRARGQLGH